jgi:hypothetical protein
MGTTTAARREKHRAQVDSIAADGSTHIDNALCYFVLLSWTTMGYVCNRAGFAFRQGFVTVLVTFEDQLD